MRSKDVQVAVHILREHGVPAWKAIFATPISLGILLVAMTVGGPIYGFLTPQTVSALQVQSQQYFSDVSGPTARVLALALIQGPYLIANFATISVAVIGMVVSNRAIADGTVESLSEQGYSASDLLRGVVLSTSLLSLLSLAVLSIVAASGVAVYLILTEVSVRVTPSAGVFVSTVVPVVFVLWANLLVTGIAFTYPETDQGVPDGVGPLLQGMVVMPAVIVHLVVTLAPDFGIEVFSFVSVGGAIVAMMVTAVKLPGWASVDEL